MRFIGDCHGKTKTLQKILYRQVPEGRVMQLGDMGLGFWGVGLPKQNDRFSFIRGNHDSPDKCRKHHNYAGEFGHKDGVFFVGGAFSIDHKWRTVDKDWWIDEQLSMEQLHEAKMLYEQIRPSVVATHEAPSEIGRLLLLKSNMRPEKGGCLDSRTAIALESMWKVHKPKHWLFGHYHIPFDQEVLGTRFQCLPELVVSEDISVEE